VDRDFRHGNDIRAGAELTVICAKTAATLSIRVQVETFNIGLAQDDRNPYRMSNGIFYTPL
jgi:hypothetical protein